LGMGVALAGFADIKRFGCQTRAPLPDDTRSSIIFNALGFGAPALTLKDGLAYLGWGWDVRVT